ncbi:MAG: hypothetical protein QNJ16_05105 [Rhodobacter sp.]|nr:hypothetical protein [Rhodobacter sp.]
MRLTVIARVIRRRTLAPQLAQDGDHDGLLWLHWWQGRMAQSNGHLAAIRGTVA